MNFKKFIRPTKWKVILAIIFLVIILFFVYLITTIHVYIPPGAKDPFLSNPIFQVVALPSLILIATITSTEIHLINPIISLIVITVLQLAYTYILSCLIVWIVNKIKEGLGK